MNHSAGRCATRRHPSLRSALATRQRRAAGGGRRDGCVAAAGGAVSAGAAAAVVHLDKADDKMKWVELTEAPPARDDGDQRMRNAKCDTCSLAGMCRISHLDVSA
jgi:hypothetical protein